VNVAALLCGALLLGFGARASAEEGWPCASCELEVGIGGTYHYWARTGGIVIPLVFTWDDGRYELGAFRMSTPQWIEFDDQPPARRFANPYWGFSLSRRWRLFATPTLRLYVGLGASYKTETDELDSTHWNFAEQLALRWDRGHNVPSVELSIRHWSNAGIRLPNRGQDFAVLTLVF
jgi:hypothetical protein